jgi:hypothetical protein
VHRSSRRHGLVAQTGVPFEVKKPLSECAVGDTSSHDGAPPRRAAAAQRAMKRGASRGGELLVRVAWWAAAGGARAQRSAGEAGFLKGLWQLVFPRAAIRRARAGEARAGAPGGPGCTLPPVRRSQ